MNSQYKYNHGAFKLQKYYLDCVTPKGEAFIAYSAKLSWKAIKLTYASTLYFDQKSLQTNTTLFNESLPHFNDHQATWSSKKLKSQGYWESLSDKLLPTTLYETNNRSVIWNAKFPRTKVKISHQNRKLEGVGYVERLDLTLPPWQIPIDLLLWGRFVTEEISLVWIKWCGSHPLTLLYLNGKQIKAKEMTTSYISWQGGELEHIDFQVLREGHILNTALAKIPGITTIFPKKLLYLFEEKWLSLSKLTINGKTYQGWSIHEKVTF